MSQSKRWKAGPLGRFVYIDAMNQRYYGSYLKDSALWIVMEYCSGGSCSDLV